MKIHILGICGTFMGSIAVLAKQLGHTVSGSDENVYPPMSTQLESQGIALQEGYEIAHLQPAPDVVIVGNTVSRGNKAVEYVLNEAMPYQSGPEWLSENLLRSRHVLAVSGTHGKTTTSSMLAWILEYSGLKPGFLIGGVAENFGISARLGESDYFVVEADEYDTAFFDKRSKFIHYHPGTLLINNIEFDHADIFADIASIRREFHNLLRTLSSQANIIRHAHNSDIDQVIEQGCWSHVSHFAENCDEWSLQSSHPDYSRFHVLYRGEPQAELSWELIGKHNAENALGAIACASCVGVSAAQACEALRQFKSVKRRLETIGSENGITIYDDFAHHPSAIAATLGALKTKLKRGERLIAVMEPRSNTMKMGVHRKQLVSAFTEADQVFVYQPGTLKWDVKETLQSMQGRAEVFSEFDQLPARVAEFARQGDHIVVMSNGSFQGIHQLLLQEIGALS